MRETYNYGGSRCLYPAATMYIYIYIYAHYISSIRLKEADERKLFIHIYIWLNIHSVHYVCGAVAYIFTVFHLHRYAHRT